ncbi:asparagine synthase-related protein [Radiobacillus sp. PE A8.2]|uniref:asparagine synthase-related protein n=1 Tax=Radiobacillus sp. PE A8.2 TaxID=3380349 RepID=UPI00388FCE07
MSAIAGIYQMNKQIVSDDVIEPIMQSLDKFPIDDIQIWKKDHLFFSCHAQWITPESIGERIPYYDAERQLTITADAIIDNRNELFDLLQVSIYERKLVTDSELILLAYAKWGERVPTYLVGDFAFVIWDGKNNKLFAARDFSGMRTLYYYQDAERVAFSTVMESLVRLPYVSGKLNEQWLAEYLAIRDMTDTIDGSITIMEDINQLPPCHMLKVEDNKVVVKKYETKPLNKLKFKKDEEYVEAFREVFQTAIDDRLRTYGQVGAQLSGGLNSGAVVSFAAETLKMRGKKLNTYSFVPEKDFFDWTPSYQTGDERSYMEEVVDHVGGIHANYLSFTGDNPYSTIDEWLQLMEMPYKFFENSFWIKGIFEQAKNDDVKVLLNGDRGNYTIGWGSAIDHYRKLLNRGRWLKLSKEVKQYSRNQRLTRRRVKAVIKKRAQIYGDNFPTLVDNRFPLINERFAKKHQVAMDMEKKVDADEIRRKHFENTNVWNATGTAATKLSLQYGVWNRDPSNDLRVVQFCLALPEDQFVQDGFGRALIRRATEGYLPDNVRLNQRTRGMQSADWMDRMILDKEVFIDELKQLVKDPIFCEYIDNKSMTLAIEQLEAGPKAEDTFHPNIRNAMRAVVVYRFIKSYLYNADVRYERVVIANS